MLGIQSGEAVLQPAFRILVEQRFSAASRPAYSGGFSR